MAAREQPQIAANRNPRLKRTPIVRVWAELRAAATGSAGMCPPYYVALWLVLLGGLDRGRSIGCDFQTPSGSGEPEGKGAASRLPFLPVSIVANKKRKSRNAAALTNRQGR